jgi:hypothetical protein
MTQVIEQFDALLREWQADIDGCMCKDVRDESLRSGLQAAGVHMPCETCMTTARHIGALKGTIDRLRNAPLEQDTES